MITEDYVSFEIAKLLKEKGFREKTIACYDNNGKLLDVFKDTCSKVEPQDWNGSTQSEYNKIGLGSWYKNYSAPTLHMAMKWLREVHHYYIQVMLDSWAYGSHSGYYVIIQKTNSEFEIMLADKTDKVFYDEPEEACEAAIKYCLENLI